MKRFKLGTQLVLLAMSISAYAANPEDARTTLVIMAETGSRSASPAEVRKLVESYRLDSGSAFLPLATAPYPSFLINAQLGELYPALYPAAKSDSGWRVVH